jgi:mono/diheme cytochrome c family protein
MRLTGPLLKAGAGLACLIPLVIAGAADPTDINSGIYSEAQAQQGALVYATHCATCHGATLNGSAAPTLNGPFWSSWSGRSVGELFQLVQGSMPQDAPSSLSDAEYAAIVAHMLKTGGYPAGTTALPASADALVPIKIGPHP